MENSNQTEATTVATTTPTEPTHTTATSTPIAAPVAPTAPVVEAKTEAEVEQTAPTTEAADDYSWVPPKFKLDGKPDFQKLATSYAALEKKISAKAGVAPDSLDDYVYEAKSVQFDADDNVSFKEFAKEINLSPTQYAKVLEKYEESYGRTAETPAKAQEYLQKQWGDDFERNTQLAIKAFEAYAPSHIPLEAIGNNPYVIDLLSRFGAELGEDVVPQKKATNSRMSRDDVKALMAKPEYNQDTKEGKALQAQVTAWYEKNTK